MLSSSRSALGASGRSVVERVRARPRLLSTARPRPTTHLPGAWKYAATATVLATGLAVFPLIDSSRDLSHVLPQVEADEPTVSGYIDPTSKTPFPTHLQSPTGKRLVLVGTGVRTVSFLAIKVYAGAVYVEEHALARFRAAYPSYTPDKLLPPFPKATDDPYGERLVAQILDTADVAIVIVPLRNTNLPHLRDGFARGLLARLKLPHVTEAMTDAENEAAPAAITEMRSLFPSRTLLKGAPLELYYSAQDRQVQFQSRAARDAPPDVLGKLTHPKLARELILSYFSDSLETSLELRKSVADGLAGAPRLQAV
ncbi:hypothetical protein ACM66B_000727 [Microbotryomycetes sp. NB124-2]